MATDQAGTRPPGIHPGDIVDLGRAAITGPTLGRPCDTCGRTYGLALPHHPRRCGCCISGLSLDGMPVWPDPETGISPITGGRCIRLPGGVWSYEMTATAKALGLDPSPEAELARSVRALLADWPGYRALLIADGVDPAVYERREARDEH